jgi:hypothetical protein
VVTSIGGKRHDQYAKWHGRRFNRGKEESVAERRRERWEETTI